jgi:signal transduction histidine kinase
MTAVLRVPLLGKLLGANVLLLLSAFVAHAAFPDTSMAVPLGLALLFSFGVSAGLVWLALRPIVELERTAARVSRGDFSARVLASPVADRDILRLSTTMNRLLERVEADRARIQYLAGRAVRARDIEREHVARELRESVAQTVTGLTLEVAAARTATRDTAIAGQLDRVCAHLQQLTDEMRGVAETLYPGTLGEFGLLNALRALARRASRQAGARLHVDVPEQCAGLRELVLSPQAASALYRVADEALRNVTQHADARNAMVRLACDVAAGEVRLEIEDDGRGVDMRTNDPLHAGLGLFSAKAVLALAGGDLQISSAPGLGTRVFARVPAEPTRTE